MLLLISFIPHKKCGTPEIKEPNEKIVKTLVFAENSPNPSSAYIRLCKHREKVSYCFYKVTSSNNYNAGKDKNSFY